MRRAFTMIELLLAVMLVGVVTSLAVSTFHAVVNGWTVSTDYLDKLQRTDFGLNQVISGLRSMYYPHDGAQSYDYGFQLFDNGDGDDPDSSDVIQWSKTGQAIVGSKSSVADTVHHVQLMVLEEGNRDWEEPIEITGLYARLCPDSALRPKDDGKDVDYSFSNDEMYQPVLIADGIVGFDCKVLKTQEDQDGRETDDSDFEDEFETSNAVPYKVMLTFRMADPEGRAYRRNTAPIVRIVRIPVHEQSLDGAAIPGEGGTQKQQQQAAAGARAAGGRARAQQSSPAQAPAGGGGGPAGP